MSDMLLVARTEALVLSDVPAGATLTRETATEAIRKQVVARHGVHGCAEDFAQYYGDHPVEAQARTQWARTVVLHLFTPSHVH